jgi:hypothetical protein
MAFAVSGCAAFARTLGCRDLVNGLIVSLNACLILLGLGAPVDEAVMAAMASFVTEGRSVASGQVRHPAYMCSIAPALQGIEEFLIGRHQLAVKEHG